MRVGIEAQRALRPNRHGMDVVALETIRALAARSDVELVVFVDRPDERGELPDNVEVVVVRAPTWPVWEQLALPRAAAAAGVDLLHCTSNTAPLDAGVPVVLTLHDVIFLSDDPELRGGRSTYQQLGWWYRRAVVPRVAARAAAVITVSRYEQRRIAEVLGRPRDSVDVIYNGLAPAFQRPTDPTAVARCRAELGLDRPYLVFLGNTDPKKNSERVVRAWARAKMARPDAPDLVVADLPSASLDSWLAAEGASASRGAVRAPGYLPQERLVHLVDGATAFLYPSLAESFGLPMIEAMARGRAVITSTTTAMPEIAGDAALLVDPTRIDALANAIEAVTSQPALRSLLEARGPARAAAFRWDAAADSLLDLYARIADRASRAAA